MIFITGPLYAGKRSFAKSLLQCDDEALTQRAIWDVQNLAAQSDDLLTLAESLSAYEVVIATEVGAGIVPMEAGNRAAREAAGQLSCLLAARADCVLRLFCGIPTVLKGSLPC